MRALLRPLALFGACLLLTGCFSPTMYVDPSLPSVSKSDLTSNAAPQPVQLLYEFQTKGAPNARGTELTKGKVLATVTESGLFTIVSGEPQADQRRLAIIINNVPVTQNAAAKGVGVGLTFGLVGNMVTDGYECTASYVSPGAEPLKFTYTHAIHSTIGNADGPPGLKAEPSTAAALGKVVEQLTWSALRDLSKSGRL
jgi:hypothetical protein